MATVKVYSNPIARFGFTKTCLGDYTNFWNNSYTIGNNGTINQWDWDLDGFIGTTEATGPQATSMFNTIGNHAVGLTVTTTYGCKNTATLNVFVNAIPVVDFIADKTAGCEKLPVIFTNNSYIATGGITSYSCIVSVRDTITLCSCIITNIPRISSNASCSNIRVVGKNYRKFFTPCSFISNKINNRN